MRAIFLDLATVDTGDLDLSPLQSALPDWVFFPHTTAAELAERLRDAVVVVSNKVRLDAAALSAAPQLRLILIAATGTNNVDLDAAHRRGITVCNVRGYSTASVAQLVFSYLLELYGRLGDYREAVRAGQWQSSTQFCLLDYPIRELAGKRLGIVGFGDIGQAVAAIARAFGMEVLVAQRPGGQAQTGRLSLSELLPRIDVLTLHCPLTPETRGLIGGAELKQMRPDAVLINAARGGIVDEAALAEALRAGRLGGAGIDVLSVEPPVSGNPLLDPAIPNLIVTPHIGWASREARQRLVNELALNCEAYVRGTPRNVV